jgi:hypothetical protein
MFDRRNQILAIILIAQIAIAAFLFWPKPATSDGGVSLLPDFDPATVVALTVKAGDAPDTQVDLVKEGDEWVLAEADSYPANSTQVTEILDKLHNINTARLVTQTDASHGRLQVAADNFNRLVQMKTDDGEQYDLYVGSSAGGTSTHVRAADEDNVYLTNEIVSWDLNAQPSGWINTQYFNIPVTNTVRLSLTNANGTFEFAKDETGWHMQGLEADEIANENDILSFYNQARAVSMLEPVGKTNKPEYGMDSPSAVLKITNVGADEEKTYTLTIGAPETDAGSSQTDAATYIAKSSESPYYARLAAFTGNTFVNKQRSDFLQTPQTEPNAVQAE